MSKNPRFDWFQTDTDVILTILKRGVHSEQCTALYKNKQLTVKNGEETIFDGLLTGEVQSDAFTILCTPLKVEIKMPKAIHGERWNSLVQTSVNPSTLPFTPMVSTTSTVNNKTSKKNWDAIEKEAAEEENNEETVGDAAVNKMFRKIYEEASDDVKKAMMKSYQESGGTVLSTNWADISSRKVEVQPPDCMEYKKFES